jgi:lipoate-protein ligase A
VSSATCLRLGDLITEAHDLLSDWPHSTWRLLNTGLNDGATTLAVDEAILSSVAGAKSPPTLRFYGWQPPCVSIGYAQSLQDEIDLDACERQGYTWVRRPTGGRAVLHIDELTYSVIVPQGDPRVAGDIVTSYRRLSLGLVTGLRLLGCDVVQANAQRKVGAQSAACFDVPSHYEVTALGRKLVGSAQVRRKGVVLQHGALPLMGDVSRLVDALALDEPSRASLRAKLRRRAIALDEAMGRPVSFDEVAVALKEGFARALGLAFEPGELSADERADVAALQTKYEGDAWTLGRARRG